LELSGGMADVQLIPSEEQPEPIVGDSPTS
jgi:hypothetical protein